MLDRNLISQYKFNPFYEMLGDYDLWIRISMQNKILCINKILEYSRQHGNNFSKIFYKKMIKEKRYFYKNFLKNYSFWHFPEIFIYILKCELNQIKFNILAFFKIIFSFLNIASR